MHKPIVYATHRAIRVISDSDNLRVSDIYFTGHGFGDEGLTVFFEEFDFALFCGCQVVNLLCFAVKEIGDLLLFRISRYG